MLIGYVDNHGSTLRADRRPDPGRGRLAHRARPPQRRHPHVRGAPDHGGQGGRRPTVDSAPWTSSGTPTPRPACSTRSSPTSTDLVAPPRGPGVAARAGDRPRLHAAAPVPARAAPGLRGVRGRRRGGRHRRAQRADGAVPDHPADLRPRPGRPAPARRHRASSVAELLVGESLLGLATLVCDLGPTRLGVCSAAPCTNVYVDTSPNQSRRYCSDRCSSRANVAAYRARQRKMAAAGWRRQSPPGRDCPCRNLTTPA